MDDSEDKEHKLAPNDPYNTMDTARDEVRPDFLDAGDDGDGSDRKSGNDLRQKASKAALTAVEIAAGVPPTGLATGEGGDTVKMVADMVADSAKGLYSKNTGGGEKKKKGKAPKFSLLFVVIIMIAVVPAMLSSTNIPLFLIGHISLNLQDALGFTSTSAILEKQASYITQEALMNGEVAKAYADDLATHGIEVGQVTQAGNFVKTNVYIADLDDDGMEIANTGQELGVASNGGELSVRFRGRIIPASDFVAILESDPELYGEYSEASGISAKYYFSEEVENVYQDLDISRSSFDDWVRTGDKEADQESYNELLAEALDDDPVVDVNGHDPEDDRKDYTVRMDGEASSLVESVGARTTGSQSTERASQLLNVAISSTEPIKAAKAYSAIAEELDRVRADGDGPIDETMRTLDEVNTVYYQDAVSGQEISQTESILTNNNFVSAVSMGSYNRNEALNFSRDRALYVTDSVNNGVIHGTTLATNGKRKSNTVLRIGDGNSADMNRLSKAVSSVSVAISQKSSELFKGVVGANRIISGGSFLSNSINSQIAGAVPSDAATIEAYHREVDKVLARRAVGERATKSPFDISSKYTFLGSIVHSFASSIIANRKSVSGAVSTSSVFGVLADFVGGSAKGLLGTVVADGPSQMYDELLGSHCVTVNSVMSLEGDLYCTQHNTMSTKYMNYTKEDYDNALTEREKERFALLTMDRKTTVGIRDGDICETYKKEGFLTDDKGIFVSAFLSLQDLLSNLVGLYNSCNIVDDDIRLGSEASLSSENADRRQKNELLSAYARYDIASSIVNGTPSEMAGIIEDYHKKHPLDQSPEGRLARISGLSKEEAGIAINYANYLTKIANYNPSTRYAFGEKQINVPIMVEFVDDKEVDSSVYLAWFSKIEYSDVRNRSFVV